MDLLLVLPHLGDGGTQRVVTRLAEHWRGEGRSVAILTLFRVPDTFDVPTGVERHRVDLSGDAVGRVLVGRQSATPLPGSPRLDRVRSVAAPFRVALDLRRILRRLAPRTCLSFLTEANVLVALAGAPPETRVVFCERNDPRRDPTEQSWRWLRRLVYRRADLVLANSTAALEPLGRYVARSRLGEAPNPIPMPTDAELRERRREEPAILAVGRLHPQKRLAALLRGFAILPSRLDTWRLRVLGRGPLEADLRRLAGQLGIAGRLDWLGHCDAPEREYARAGIYALTSAYEGTPNALLEAMSWRVPPVVATESPGVLALVQSNRTGIATAPDDPPGLAAALTRLADDRAARRALGRAAREAVAPHSTPEAMRTWSRLLGLPPPPERPGRS